MAEWDCRLSVCAVRRPVVCVVIAVVSILLSIVCVCVAARSTWGFCDGFSIDVGVDFYHEVYVCAHVTFLPRTVSLSGCLSAISGWIRLTVCHFHLSLSLSLSPYVCVCV